MRRLGSVHHLGLPCLPVVRHMLSTVPWWTRADKRPGRARRASFWQRSSSASAGSAGRTRQRSTPTPSPPPPRVRLRAPRLVLAEVQLGERAQRGQARRERERAAVAQLVLAQREPAQARLPCQRGRQRARAGCRHLVQRELQLLQLRAAVRQRLRPAHSLSFFYFPCCASHWSSVMHCKLVQ